MRNARIVLMTVMFLSVTGVLVKFGVDWTVESAVSRDSVKVAERWASFAASRLPRIEELIEDGLPDDEQMRVIEEVRAVGDVFRFKLFDDTGRLSLVSDDKALTSGAGVAAEADPEPVAVLASGEPIIEVKDGRAKPDRPPVYVEAYIPVLDSKQKVIGVAEVYVDQTETYAYFYASFQLFGIILGGGITLIIAVPLAIAQLNRLAKEKAQQNAEYLARFDPLTGVMNRREFAEQFGRAGDKKFAAVAFIDIDRFKQINDGHGHAVGDAMLSHIADVLKRSAGLGDLIARFGGDEFVLALRDNDETAIHRRMNRLLRDCAQEISHEGVSVSASVSVGVSLLEGGGDLDTALTESDAALYAAKAAGRNQYAIYGVEMGERLQSRRRIEARVRAALADQEYALHFQPLVEAGSGQLVGYEGLLRLQDEDGQAISPMDFIPVAEELGLISELGRWVIETGVREAATWDNDAKVALNLSSAQFQPGDLPEIVRDALHASGLPARRLELEITESLLLSDEAAIKMQLDQLQELGVSIALDDFGTGFSSLAYLWRYNFNKLKIDQSFVAALEHSPERAEELIETIVMLSRRLGMEVTAEGVETSEQSAKLREIGCDTLQGFLYGRPGPVQRDAESKSVA